MDLVPRYEGVYRAVVKYNKDPKHLRRIRVVVPQITGDQVTDWIWPVLSTKRPPAVGTGTWVMYIGGNPEYPVWIGEFGEDPQGLMAYGSWCNTGDLTATPGVGTAIPLTTAFFEEGVFLKDSSKLVIEEPATYNIQFSAQIHNTGGGGAGQSAYLWFAKNGTAIDNSATSMVVGSNEYQVMTVNLFEYMKADDYFQVFWSNDNANIRLENRPASSPYPAVPSVIVTVNQIA